MKRLLACSIILILAISLCRASKELADNRGFEAGTTLWTSYTLKTFTIVTSATGQVRSGTYSAELVDTKDSGFIYQQVSVVPGSWYSASGWFYDNDTDGAAAVRIYWYDENDKSLSSDASAYSIDAPAWQYLATGMVQAPGDAAYCKLEAYVKVSVTTTTVYADDLSLLLVEGTGADHGVEQAVKVLDSPFYPREDLLPHNCILAYSVPDNTIKTMKIYDINGAQVRTVMDNDASVSGKGSYYWTGRDDDGGILPTGVYIVHMTAVDPNGRPAASGSATVIIGRRLKTR